MKYIYLLGWFVLVQLTLLPAQTSVKLPIKYYCTNWGMQESWARFCAKVKTAGYDGIETWLPATTEEQQEMLTALKKHNLSLGLLVGGSGTNFEQYAANFRSNLEAASKHRPDYINCHTGKDYYTFEQNERLITLGEKISKHYNLPVYHETHRGRFSFAAHVTKGYLDKIPHLQLALDISHWCNVHESLLEDQEETVAQALRRTSHIHARIGHPEGPQVNDPAAPEWKSAVDRHLAWWDEVVMQHKTHNRQLTITTEFGPAGYLPTLPYTQQPVADQWQINVYMLHLLKARYATE
ncbi:sugar phosphate isomerase/epimerase family protein [Sphingobacterium deserti]|uniref:Xylose isomerase domain-containing protein TIM barrel n=1 Tax=Sphingobacterium deserti TaxID=1229276 RepID=A0A0B8SZ89_9SPHI|nr:TIM barrel protein [Sphingobacterium deserti]KGE12696.1 xylose isomerase domain-containing protein TIM barrel [Sphingobacterium deserti]